MDLWVDPNHIKKEKDEARKLRKSRWWQNKIAKVSCYYCQNPLKRDAVTMDHVVPLAQGGRSSKGNVVPACKPCNMTKKDRSAAEWLMN